MKFDSALNRRLIAATAEAVIAHADELGDLDRAIGDGDHGLNMKRGFEAVLADLDGLAGKRLPDLLKGLGTHLVMKVGGASGPLYGTLFLALGKELPAEPSLSDAARAFGAAIAAVKARGKTGTILIVGFDAIPEAAKAIQSGNLAASVAQNPANMGKFGVENALKLLQGKTIPKRIDTGTTLVTKTNAAKYAK